jgi:hypothetical protein
LSMWCCTISARDAGPHLSRRQAVHFGVATIIDDDAMMASNMTRPRTMLFSAYRAADCAS